MSILAKNAIQYIDEKRDNIIELSDKMWELAELALWEHKSAELLVEGLKAEGFTVETGAGGMPSAIVAQWGSGKPVIGFLAEYDALTNVSNKPVPVRDPLIYDGPGHGCGHNLLGAASYGAAIALKKEMEAQGLKGTVRFYGCPAEENLSGKAFMARDGVFKDCDIALTWHPGAVNRVSNGSSLANNAAYFTFYGRSAHAAGDPHNGRSALDAVQLMNMGVEFLREHMPPRTRAHYVITNGGGQPNVVPPEAQVWYLVRAAERQAIDDLWERIIKCAKGAAEMTDTRFEINLLKAIYNVLNNDVLEDVLDEAMKRVGPPKFTAEDQKFAEEISKTWPETTKKNTLRERQIPEKWWDKHLNDEVIDRPAVPDEPRGSTDVGDVSWCCPTAQFSTACQALGTPGHSWQYAAQAGMSIGHSGMITAAKVMAEAGYVMMTNPELVEKAWAEFRKRTGGVEYKSPMPADQKPAFHVFADKYQK